MRYLFCILMFFVSLSSSGIEKPKKTDYPKEINQLVFRLSCNANDRTAAKKLVKTYSGANAYYQKEIDQLKLEPDSFRWTKTYDLLEERNQLSEEILYNSEANRVICDPEFYDVQLAEAKAKAIQELYDSGIQELNSGEVKNARKAYWHFERAIKLGASFPDINLKMREAGEKAAVRILVDRVGAYIYYKNVSAERFYNDLLARLQSEFLLDRFVSFYTISDIAQRKIKPDLTLNIAFFDIEITRTSSPDGSTFGYINGVAEVKMLSNQENQNILEKRIPKQFIWKNYAANYGSDLQGMFDSFSLSTTDEIFELLTEFIRKKLLN